MGTSTRSPVSRAWWSRVLVSGSAGGPVPRFWSAELVVQPLAVAEVKEVPLRAALQGLGNKQGILIIRR